MTLNESYKWSDILYSLETQGSSITMDKDLLEWNQAYQSGESFWEWKQKSQTLTSSHDVPLESSIFPNGNPLKFRKKINSDSDKSHKKNISPSPDPIIIESITQLRHIYDQGPWENFRLVLFPPTHLKLQTINKE